ncbi:hypothetical protein TVAG_283790 [Trichomonas vaginalis G3]|uniref:Uncharacterized protein n=1 Tax=Trichomonas vaginalis (strain ATCC PRA-98 / G3) TaxID=412133 RepID=A2DET3_TRIV3|nr:armadillo (ARM) repeat-containing protein family [Trichomonas vaginalis G3]EAY21210.1 hypothetical protein TVAG_283790 [Trichomonas vaginalis G3]KAI5522261.1 armadillo (ARM) repeat-containing protein family [Trichomonas vaginalis G3]|eukprot:XP_001582196.1 hypothetical protein [Trichomonas vaginalis G3]
MNETETSQSPNISIDCEEEEYSKESGSLENNSGPSSYSLDKLEQNLNYIYPKIPVAMRYNDFGIYKKEVIKWYEQITSKLEEKENSIPISFTLKRPAVDKEMVDLSGTTSKMELSSFNRLWLQKILITSETIDPAAQFPNKINQRYRPLSLVFTHSGVFSDFIQEYPKLSNYDTYESYEEASVNWYKKQNLYNNEIYNPDHFSKYMNYARVNSNNPYTPIPQHKYAHFDQRFLTVKFSENSERLKDSIQVLYRTYKQYNFTKLKITYQEVKNFQNFQENRPITNHCIIERLFKNFLNPGSPLLFSPFEDDFKLAKVFFDGAQYNDIYMSNLPPKVTIRQFHFILAQVNSKTSNLVLMCILDIFKDLFTSSNITFMLGMFQDTKVLLTLGYIINKLIDFPTRSYFVNAYLAWPIKVDDQIINHTIKVLSEKSVANTFLHFFTTTGLKDRSSLAQYYQKMTTTQIEILFENFLGQITNYLENHLSKENLDVIVSIFNMILDCHPDQVAEFYNSFNNVFAFLNEISLLDSKAFMRIMAPMLKIQTNTILFVNMYVPHIEYISLEELYNYSNYMFSIIATVFSMSPNKIIFPKYDWICSMITHLVQLTSDSSSFALYCICNYLCSLLSSKIEYDKGLAFNCLTFLTPGLQNKVIHAYFIRAFGKILILPQSISFLKSYNLWTVSLFKQLESSNYETQRYAWRTFHAIADQHLDLLAQMFKNKNIMTAFSNALMNLSLSGLTELYFMLTYIFGKNLKPLSQYDSKSGKGPSVFFGIQNIHPDLIAFCYILSDSGFKLDEFNAKISNATGPDSILSGIIFKYFKRVFNDRKYMRGLLDRNQGEIY